MAYPVSSTDDGIKIKPELMEKEKMYYCFHNNKLLLVYKDEQDFLNCYEIEEPEIVSRVTGQTNHDEIEKLIDEYLSKQDIKH
ncbi:MAG: hypothetical protein QXG67_04290 [Candidatus Nitrosotenuis sp.]